MNKKYWWLISGGAVLFVVWAIGVMPFLELDKRR